MKKLFYILGIGLLMASCTDDYKDWADPMSNSEDAKSATAVVTAASAIDFNGLAADSVDVFNPNYTIGEGVNVINYLTLYNADKTANFKLAVDEQGRVKASELREGVEFLYGLTDETLTVPMNVQTLLIDENGEAFRFVNDIEDNIKLAAGVSLVNGNEITPIPMTSVGVYTLTIDVPKVDNVKQDMNIYFRSYTGAKLASDVETTGIIGGGNLAEGNDAFDIKLNADDEFNQYTITVNTTNMTYNVEGIAFADMIWQAGNANGWGSPAAGLKHQGWKDGRVDGKYFGFMYLNGDFKFRSQQNSWDAPDWGAGATEGTLAAQAGNLWAAEGFYRVEADLKNMTYALTPITTIGVIGGFNGWASDYAKLTYNTTTGAWEGTCDITAGTEFKFRANESWDINWGGDLSNLSFDGGNITLDADGTYFIQLFLTYEGDFHVTFTK